MSQLPLLTSYFVLVCAIGPAPAAANADIVNERPTANALEREAHWGVDCAETWADMHLVLRQPSPHCELAPDLLESLRLCGYIYQPPGGPKRGPGCRDFSGVVQRQESSCEAIGAWLVSQPDCSGSQ